MFVGTDQLVIELNISRKNSAYHLRF
jgi:hypothetical protein